jgi:large subunit ribosomal protein L9
MDVILREDVEHVGLRGDVVSVARGYARNYLLPRQLAEPATPAKVAELRRRDAQRARHEAKSVDEARQIAAKLGQLELRFDVKAGPTGALFGSITATNLADTIWESAKIRVDRRRIDLHDPIKRIGRYAVGIEVFQDVPAEVRVLVVPEGGELPPEEELEALAAEEAAAAHEEERRHELEHAEAEAAIEEVLDEPEAADEPLTLDRTPAPDEPEA